MSPTEQWCDLCRKSLATTGSEKAALDDTLAVISKTSQALLNRKLSEGYEALEPMKVERAWLVKVIESTRAPITGAGTGAVFLEVFHTCKIRRLK